MTGEVKRYSNTGAMHMPESPFGEYVLRAAHLAVVEGLRATLAERDEECRMLSAQNVVADEGLAAYETRIAELEGALRDVISWVPGPRAWHTDAPAKAVRQAQEILARPYVKAAIDEAMRGGDGRG